MINWLGIVAGTLRSLLRNQRELALDFFTVPTAALRILFVLIVLSHDRRRIPHFSVTDHPTAAWTVRQLLEAFGLEGFSNISCAIAMPSMEPSFTGRPLCSTSKKS